MPFSDIYILRLGAGVAFPSACAGFEQRGTPPASLPVTSVGQGLGFRYVITPQVWAVTGDGQSLSFDGRTVDLSDPSVEVGHRLVVNGDTIRFTVTRPTPGGTGADYARLASVTAFAAGVERRYSCVIGISTLAADLPTSGTGSYARLALLGTAQRVEGGVNRAYTLERSVITVAADWAARRVTITLRLIGTPSDGGPIVTLGDFTASGAIDPANGNFNVPLGGAQSGAVSGRFYGPAAIEIGAAFGGAVAANGAAPAFSFAGGLFGAR
ncbi:MAG: hypothetical protein A4S12_07155 [Proteobacteria bacterium SG_bin5]|nr:hypothetical protein [Sphingomonas sp.]OQW41977.1 MAG: hypothetical protein A4S12_07155 [Proteobacteria bacterium SG_bin5]